MRMPMDSIGLFMAFGTLGDVLPVAFVAVAVARATTKYTIKFVTHASHQVIRKLLEDFNVKFCPISSPAVLPPGSFSECIVSDAHLEECLKAIEDAFEGFYGPNNFIAINFFALEGWHIAEIYNAQCIVLAPYVMPYSAPASFERTFKKLHPLLHKRLQHASPEEVGWKDVMHWMWPLFTDRWTSFRVEKLHLSACPLTDPVTELPVHNWPRAVPLLYGFSKEVVDCPSYWPSSIRICGFWYPPADWQYSKFPEMLADFLLEDTGSKPVFIGLSSISSMGFLHNPEGMIQVISKALKETNKRGILFTYTCASLEAAIAKVMGLPSFCNGLVLDERLFCFSGYVPYSELFAHCSLVIHHGGSGTTAACLYAGVPQIICPFILDQFYWGERMAWIGVSPQLLKSSHLIPEKGDDISQAVDIVVSSIMQASDIKIKLEAINLAKRIQLEDGCHQAVEIFLKQIFNK